MQSNAVPLIDISPVLAGDGPGTAAVAAAIAEACQRIGFFLIAGHGVPEATTDDAYRAARAFFDLPMETKLEVVRRRPEISRG